MTAANHTTFDVVVVVYRGREAVTALLECLDESVPVIVVDNSRAADNLADLSERFVNVRTVDAGGNLGFSAGANVGAEASSAEYLVFMNPDTIPSADSLETMISVLAASPGTASCGAAGIGTAGGGAQPTVVRTVAHSLGLHRIFPMAGIYFYPRHGERVSVGWVSGSCLAIRRSDFDAVGGFDESYFVFMSDFEIGRRIEAAGRSQLVLGDVTVPHIDGASTDLPAQWTWEERGKGWAQYLARTMPLAKGASLAGILLSGYVARYVLYAVTGRRLKARELATYSRALASEWRRETGSVRRSRPLASIRPTRINRST